MSAKSERVGDKSEPNNTSLYFNDSHFHQIDATEGNPVFRLHNFEYRFLLTAPDNEHLFRTLRFIRQLLGYGL
jgi:hypothetical protein